ncbi:hypothetical protein HYX05_03420 [Candidatus Woesearchaeota archaeon]|nr:hypothetical protein [Candidatus Woesearchaeota archaeon]
MIELLIASQLRLAEINPTHNYQHQNPAVYAQDSSQPSEAKHDTLERMLSIYRNLIFKPGTGRNVTKMALEFYNDIIKEKQNGHHLAEAYSNSGYILCMMDPKDIDEGLKRLDKAYEIGNDSIKIRILHLKFTLAKNYEGSSEKNLELRSPEHYIIEMEKLDPNLAKKLKRELERVRKSQNSK